MLINVLYIVYECLCEGEGREVWYLTISLGNDHDTALAVVRNNYTNYMYLTNHQYYYILD